MKLYLSSYRLGKKSSRLTAMVGSANIALIPNALDAVIDKGVRQAVIERTVRDLSAIGLDSCVVDLRQFFHLRSRLHERIAGFQAMFVTGGNAFVLRRAMAQSGFDELILSNSDNPDFLYAGYSAGACVCSPRLNGLEIIDDAVIVPKGYHPEPIFEGLSLIPYSFIPHFQSDHPESDRVERMVHYCIDHKVPFRAYRDGEVLICQSRSDSLGLPAPEPC